MLLCIGIALAAPGDPNEDLAWRIARAEGGPVVLGGSERSPWAVAALLDGMPVQDPAWRVAAGAVRQATDPEDLALDGQTIVALRGWTLASLGDGPTQLAQGDAEPGLVSLRSGAEVVAYHPWLEARLAAEARVDAAGSPLAVDLLALEYFLGLRRGPLRVGFGAEDRWLGPGRHGSLLMATDARPFPAGVTTLAGPIPRLGEARAEVGVGWLQLPRADVQRPGLLWMDLRWAPLPYVEVGASRMALFGGEGRPMPSVGELLLPLDPHVEEDPDRLLADSDELAAVDLRLNAPFPGGYAAAWWQYGGDDFVFHGRLPALAGVANLFGAEVAWRPLWLTVEYAALMDDRFRWYQGHRVYHQGFQQDGRWLGHPNGGDSVTWWAQAGWMTRRFTVSAWGEQATRVAVVEVLGDQVLALSAPELARRGGVEVQVPTGFGGYVHVGYGLGRRENVDFVPGVDAWEHRLTVGVRGAPWIAVGNEAPEGWR